ncbi:hypothetical protein TNCV_1687301 [Trichonephila clavipes]|nr:hypothetical protein TNCV_1687301 [Trichonephila clavipes]
MSSFLVLCVGDTKNRWRDGEVCPDVRQGTMAPWARRLGGRGEESERGDGKREKEGRKESGGENGRKEKREETAKEKTGETEKEKGLVRDWSEKTMNAGSVENGNMN